MAESPRIYAGIDPGLKGAVALYSPTNTTLSIIDMPTHTIKKREHIDDYALARFFDLHATSIKLATIERVHSMPKQGVASAFKFGTAYGTARMAVAAHFIPVVHVEPSVWKRAFGLTRDKDASRRLAGEMFPKQATLFARKKDDGRAEAALLAVWGAQNHLMSVKGGQR